MACKHPLNYIGTANGKYSYITSYHGKPLKEWIEKVHAHLSQKSNWEYRPLQPGTFGYDNMACSIARVFEAETDVKTLSLEEIASHVHDGWIENYVYWRDNQPWKTSAHFKAPFNALGDERRNKCASLKFSDLPVDEQEKDMVIARYLMATC